MKKILLLIGIIIALAIIVHAETKERREAMKNQTGQEAVQSYETLSLMRDIIDVQERMLKGTENKKTMLRQLAQLRDKTDTLMAEMDRHKPAPTASVPPQTTAPAIAVPNQTPTPSPIPPTHTP